METFHFCLANNCNIPPQARWIFITYDATNQIYYHIYAHFANTFKLDMSGHFDLRKSLIKQEWPDIHR